MRMGTGDLTPKWCGSYMGWLAGEVSSFWIVIEENEEKFWQRLLRIWYLAKLNEYEFVVMPRKFFKNFVLTLVFKIQF